MNILVLGGTRFFGIHTVRALIEHGHHVTLGTRGQHGDPFGYAVERLHLDRTSPVSLQSALAHCHFDVVIDKLAYASNDVRALEGALHCDRYIQMSTTAVYQPKRMNTPEEDFDPASGPLVWCNRGDFPYDEIKRQAERAIVQHLRPAQAVLVRYPFVVGMDDYTGRLAFYVAHALRGVPMYIDNLDCPMGLISSEEAGRFMAFLAESSFTGAINGASPGGVSIREILAYVKRKTGCAACLSPNGEPAPYNGEPAYTISTRRAQAIGFSFSELSTWLWPLVDQLIEQLRA